MSATPVNKEAIRLLVIQHGQREAARIAGLNENTVRSWAMRYKWSTPTAATKTQPHGHSALVERVADDLAEHERETRLSLAKASRRMAKDCEELPVRHAKLAHTVAQTMAIVHRQGEGSGAQSFNLNLLNLADLKLTIGGKPVE